MRFFFLSCAALLSCSSPEPTPTTIPVTPAPEASLQAPPRKLTLHPGWNPLLGRELPKFKFSQKLNQSNWDSARAWRAGDFLVIWKGSSSKDDLGLIVDTRTGEWRYITIENAPPLDVWGTDQVLGVMRPPPPPPPPPRYEYGGTFSIDGRLIFLGDNWWMTSVATMFDPVLNQWIPINQSGMPSVEGAIMVPTQDELIVWTEEGAYGARFDPLQNRWRPMSQTNAPSTVMPTFFLHPMPELIVDSDFVVWDGEQGAVYHLSSDTWTPMSTQGAPNDSDLVRVNDKLFASDGKRAGFFDPKTNQWSSVKQPKKAKSPRVPSCCGSFSNPFRANNGKLSYENEHVPNSWLEYNEETKTWTPGKNAQPQKQPKLPRDAASYYKEILTWTPGEGWRSPDIILEFHGLTKDQPFEELVLSQLWLYLPE